MKEKDARVIKVLADLGLLKTRELTADEEADIANAAARASDPDLKFAQDVKNVFDTSTKESDI